MPLVDPSPTPVVPPTSTPVIVAKMPYRGITVDTKLTDSSNLLTHVEGSSWTVNYYSQVIDSDSALSGQQVTRNPIYQQYRLIEKLELKVVTPLTTSQENVNKTLTITGSANIYPFIIPNEGDMFLADIGDGNEGIFRITSSERKSVYKNAVHTVEYQLIDYSTDERRGDLNMKVIDTFIYVRDFLKYGQNPLLRNDDYIITSRLKEYYHDLVDRYFKTFISNEFKTIILPGQTYPIYDHYLVKAIMAFFTTYDSTNIRNIRILNVDDDEVMKATSIWDVLKAKSRIMLKYAFQKAGTVTAKSFIKDPMMEGIYHSGIQYVIYPTDSINSVDYDACHLIKLPVCNILIDPPSQITNLNDLIANNEYNGLTLPESPLIKKVMVDDYYVLSKDFYNQSETGQSVLEQCVNDYLDGKALDGSVLITLCETAHAWGGLERIYYTVILLILIKSFVRET
jgi:hypothetical protein